LLDIIASPIDI